jgi:hypothetical protein
MQAHSCDWLVVRSHTDGGHVRRGAIIATHTDGKPPYTVRWLDDGKESVVFPGPDAQVVPTDNRAEPDRARSELTDQVHSTISSEPHGRPSPGAADLWSPPRHWLAGLKLQP